MSVKSNRSVKQKTKRRKSTNKKNVNSQYNPPNYLADESVNALSDRYFGFHKRGRLKELLRELINCTRTEILEQGQRPQSTHRNDVVKSLISSIEKTQGILRKASKYTKRTINKAIAIQTATLFCPYELTEFFQDASIQMLFVNGDRGFDTVRGGERIQIPKGDRRTEFMHFMGTEIIDEFLKRMRLGLNDYLVEDEKKPVRKGGQIKLTRRRLMLMNLLMIYKELKGSLPKSANGNHVDFCTEVFHDVGWQTGGIGADVPRAIEELQNRLKNN